MYGRAKIKLSYIFERKDCWLWSQTLNGDFLQFMKHCLMYTLEQNIENLVWLMFWKISNDEHFTGTTNLVSWMKSLPIELAERTASGINRNKLVEMILRMKGPSPKANVAPCPCSYYHGDIIPAIQVAMETCHSWRTLYRDVKLDILHCPFYQLIRGSDIQHASILQWLVIHPPMLMI